MVHEGESGKSCRILSQGSFSPEQLKAFFRCWAADSTLGSQRVLKESYQTGESSLHLHIQQTGASHPIHFLLQTNP